MVIRVALLLANSVSIFNVSLLLLVENLARLLHRQDGTASAHARKGEIDMTLKNLQQRFREGLSLRV
jgi:hypothetical protein